MSFGDHRSDGNRADWPGRFLLLVIPIPFFVLLIVILWPPGG